VETVTKYNRSSSLVFNPRSLFLVGADPGETVTRCRLEVYPTGTETLRGLHCDVQDFRKGS
jgi:hypothetical protein